MNEPTTCQITDLADDLPSPFIDAKIVGEGISQADYSKQKFTRGEIGYVMSRSDLCEFDICPLRWRNGYKDDGSASTEWGNLMDCMVLSPSELLERVAVKPETYTRDGDTKPWSGNAKECREWKQQNAGKLIIDSDESFDAAKATEILRSDGQIYDLLRDSQKQVMLTATYCDKETELQILVKCLIDIVPPADFLADFKTVSNAHPRAWAKHVFDYGYHVQAALYLDLFNAATKESRDEFRHVLQESFKPWQTAKRILSAEYLSIGRSTYQRILKRYCECLKSGKFDDYDSANGRDVVVDGWKITEPLDWMLMV